MALQVYIEMSEDQQDQGLENSSSQFLPPRDRGLASEFRGAAKGNPRNSDVQECEDQVCKEAQPECGPKDEVAGMPSRGTENEDYNNKKQGHISWDLKDFTVSGGVIS